MRGRDVLIDRVLIQQLLQGHEVKELEVQADSVQEAYLTGSEATDVAAKKLPATRPKAKGGNKLEDETLKQTTVRRSTRSKAKADEHTLQKTARMAVKKNLESLGTSFSSFPDSRIVLNLGRVGINLESSDNVVKASTVTIKNLEVDRLVVVPNKKKSKLNSNKLQVESDVEREDRLDAILSHSRGILNENMQDTENDHIIDLSPVRRKKKYNTTKNPNKGRLPKEPKTPSKIILK